MARIRGQCKLENCDSKHFALGYCSVHYVRFKKHGDPYKTLTQRTHADACRLEECDRPYGSLGYCTMHYLRLKSTGDPNGLQRQKNIGQCKVPTCNKNSHSLGYCKLHYRRFKKWGDPNKTLVAKKFNYIKDNIGYIELTQGEYATCDTKDFEELSEYKWQFRPDKWSGGYAVRDLSPTIKNGKVVKHKIKMHQQVMDKKFIDHKDHNGLNNQRSNLRICTISQNNRNRRVQSNNTSGHTGVVWHKKPQMWVAQIKIDGETKHLGIFKNLEDAIHAREEAEQKYFKEYRYVL